MDQKPRRRETQRQEDGISGPEQRNHPNQLRCCDKAASLEILRALLPGLMDMKDKDSICSPLHLSIRLRTVAKLPLQT